MQNLLNNKLFIILSIFLIIILGITSSCFAESENTIEITPSREGGTTSVILPSFCGTDYDYYLISAQNFYDSSFKRYTLRIGIIVSNSPLYANNSNIITNKDGSVFYYNFFEYNYKTSMSSSYDLSAVLLSDFSACYVSLNSSVFESDYFVYSNHTIYSDNTESNVVFQGAPQVEQPKVELMKATQVEEIPQQITKIVMIILPVFLAIFGTLLVLYLIKSKNLLHL